jgi:hypothetical protein
MSDVRVDMSPEAVARRLEAMAQLHRLGLSLKAARHLGPVAAVGAGTEGASAARAEGEAPGGQFPGPPGPGRPARIPANDGSGRG